MGPIKDILRCSGCCLPPDRSFLSYTVPLKSEVTVQDLLNQTCDTRNNGPNIEKGNIESTCYILC